MRVSTNKQNQALQLDAMKAAKCDALYSDPAVSGRSAERRKLALVLKDLRAGDTLVVWKIDRLSRYDTELLLLRDEFLHREITLVSLTQGIDTSTPLGRLAFGQLALFAAYEIDNLSERTRAGMAAARARGRHVGRTSDAHLREAHGRLSRRREGMTAVASAYGVSEAVLARGFKRLGLAEAA